MSDDANLDAAEYWQDRATTAEQQLQKAQAAQFDEASRHEVTKLILVATQESVNGCAQRVATLHDQLQEAQQRIELFKNQLTVQEQRTSEWHQACDTAEASLVAMTARIIELEREVQAYVEDAAGESL